MYGPTVLMTTRVDCASLSRELRSLTSAFSNGRSACSRPRPDRNVSSFVRLRPARASRVPGSAWEARYWAVRAPVNPVAPNTTMSYWRSAIAGHLPRHLEGLVGRHSGPGRHPAGHRSRHPLGRVRRLAGQIQQLTELVGGGGLGAQGLGVLGDPLLGVHGEVRRYRFSARSRSASAGNRLSAGDPGAAEPSAGPPGRPAAEPPRDPGGHAGGDPWPGFRRPGRPDARADRPPDRRTEPDRPGEEPLARYHHRSARIPRG